MEQKVKKIMDKEEKEIEKYKISIDLLKYEGEMLWKIMSPFMVVNSIILGFISQIDFKDIVPYFLPSCFFSSIFGLLLIFPWLGTFLRNSDYYHFRMAQSKDSEPDDWHLLKKDGENFAKGNQVEIKKEKYQIGCLARVMRNKRAVLLMIGMFGLCYLVLIILFGPWWIK